jgi:hypothetical protein
MARVARESVMHRLSVRTLFAVSLTAFALALAAPWPAAYAKDATTRSLVGTIESRREETRRRIEAIDALARRDFSSGCLRVDDALGLTEWVLEGTGWDRARIDAAVATGMPTELRLVAPLPVHLVYRTMALDAGDRVRLLADRYGRGPELVAVLEGEASR